MERFGFVGLPNSGKSSLFNALTGSAALAAPYAFATTDANVGIAKIVDRRLDALAAVSESKKVTPTSVQFTDIGGLVAGASRGEGLGNRFLAGIREVHAVVYVLRAFRDEDIAGSDDPLEHLQILETELTLADLESVEGQLEKKRKSAIQDPTLKPEVEALDAALAVLAEGQPIYRSGLDGSVLDRLRPASLLTNKPVMAVVNIGEADLADADRIAEPVVAELGTHAEVISMCVQLEAEAIQLPEDERTEMLEGLGLGEGALPRFIHAAYLLLDLRTFFTTGETETRAWTFRAGSRAPAAAGQIHTDFERGFIRADVIAWEDLVEAGSLVAARDAGQVRSEGKDYEVKDGDVMEIKFNV